MMERRASRGLRIFAFCTAQLLVLAVPGKSAPNAELAYVSDYLNDRVIILDANSRNPVIRGEIRGLSSPQGLAVDAAGDLYVANSGANDVLVFRARSRRPDLALKTARYGPPSDVAVGVDGTVYVSVLYQPYHGHRPKKPNVRAGCILEFKKGAVEPFAVLRDERMIYVVGVAVDSIGQLFVSTNDGEFYNAIVNRFPALGRRPTLLYTTNFAGGLAVDPRGRLLVVDQGDTEIYGQPYGSIVALRGDNGLPPLKFQGHLRDPLFISLNASGTEAWVVDPADGEIAVFAYPSGQLIQNVGGFSAQLSGIALSPAAPIGHFIP